jgi:hypothetical protein
LLKLCGWDIHDGDRGQLRPLSRRPVPGLDRRRQLHILHGGEKSIVILHQLKLLFVIGLVNGDHIIVVF